MAIVHFLLGGVCHQLPEHALWFEGRALPVCARCTGTFVGAVVALAVLWALGSGPRSELPGRGPLYVLGALGALWALDGVNSLVSGLRGRPWLYETTNALRLITGVGCGLGMGALLFPVYHHSLWRDVVAEPVLARPAHLLALLGAGAALAGVALGWRAAPYAPWWIAAVSSVLVVFALTNTVLVALVWHERGRCTRALQTMPYWLAGAALGLAEMGAMALVRRLIMG
ncbi:MAG: DUF2085 domain-containing protein [Chloroflexota bacterium]